MQDQQTKTEKVQQLHERIPDLDKLIQRAPEEIGKIASELADETVQTMQLARHPIATLMKVSGVLLKRLKATDDGSTMLSEHEFQRLVLQTLSAQCIAQAGALNALESLVGNVSQLLMQYLVQAAPAEVTGALFESAAKATLDKMRQEEPK